MKKLNSSDLHPNSIITDLKYTEDSTAESIMPETIYVEDITLKPIFDVNFRDVCKLFRYTNDDVFKHYGSTKHNLQNETRNYVKYKKDQWKNAEWFEYIIKYEGNLIGKVYLNAGSYLDSFERGCWLQKDYWGNKISQRLADALIYIVFEELDASYFNVGCVIQNVKSRKSIENYISRYNGSFYGFVPRTDSIYHPNTNNLTKVVKHPEWLITKKDYESHEKGISTTIPGLEYDDIKFKNNDYI